MLGSPTPTAQRYGLETLVSFRLRVEQHNRWPGFLEGQNAPEVNPAIGLRCDGHLEPPPGMRGVASQGNLSSLLEPPDTLDEETPQFADLTVVEVGPQGPVRRRNRKLGRVAIAGGIGPALPDIDDDIVGVYPVLDDRAGAGVPRRRFSPRPCVVRTNRRIDPLPQLRWRIEPLEVRFFDVREDLDDPTRRGGDTGIVCITPHTPEPSQAEVFEPGPRRRATDLSRQVLGLAGLELVSHSTVTRTAGWHVCRGMRTIGDIMIRRGLTRTAVFLLGMAVFSGACSGDSDPLTLEEYFAELEAIVEDVDSQFEALLADFPEDAFADEANLELFKDLLDGFPPITGGWVDRAKDLDPPAEVEDAHNDLIDAGEALLVAHEERAEAMGDAETMAELETISRETDPSTAVAEAARDTACVALVDIAVASDIHVSISCARE